MENKTEGRSMDNDSKEPLMSQHQPQQQGSYPQQQFPQQPYPQQPPPYNPQQHCAQPPYPQQPFPQQQLYPHQQLAGVTYGAEGQQTTVVLATAPVQPVVVAHPESFTMQMILACATVFFCAGCICGGVAFYLASKASDAAARGQAAEAKALGRKSTRLSICCIVTGSVLFTLIFVLSFVFPFLLTFVYYSQYNNMLADMTTTTSMYYG